MVVALKPILDAVGIERINVATYQSVSGAGAKGVRELASQTADLLNAKPIEPKAFTRQIAFNVIPHIDVFQENGYTKEEMKMVWETRKILEAPDILVNPTCVRVPVFYGHSEAVHIETRDKITRRVERAHCCAKRRASRCSTNARTVAIQPRSSMAPARMRFGSVASAKTSRIRADSICGSFPTMSVKGRP